MAFGKTAEQKVADETQKAAEGAAKDQERARREFLASPIGQATTAKEQDQRFFEIQLEVGSSQRDATVLGSHNTNIAQNKTETDAGTLAMGALKSASAGAIPAKANGDRLSPEPVHGRRIDLGRVVGAPVMVFLLVFNALPLFSDANPRGSWSTATILATRLLTICFYAFIIAIYLRRSPAVATSASRRATAAALLATYLPFALGLVNSDTPSLLVLLAANALLILGLSFSLWSLRSLDRSFSIIAQARAVVRRGPYRIVRHPLYTGELTAALGIVLLKPGWATFAIWVSLCGLQAY